MNNNPPLVTGVLNLHREGELLIYSFQSLLNAMRNLSKEGISWEILCIIDRGNDETRKVINNEITKSIDNIEEIHVFDVDFGDLGLSRNEATRKARGKYIGFLDGDDLCSQEWFLRAYKQCTTNELAIAHPAVNIYFGRYTALHVHHSQSSYDLRTLFFHNLWTALSFASKDVYESLPYETNEVSNGLGYEDWNFNCRAIVAGYQHVAVPETSHFIRVKAQLEGLCEQTANNLCVIKHVPLWSWLSTKYSQNFSFTQSDELVDLISGDPSTISLSKLPKWLKSEIDHQAFSLNISDRILNFSPLTANPLASLVSSEFLKRIGNGFDEIHFVKSAAAVSMSTERSLIIGDIWSEKDDICDYLAINHLEKFLNDKVILFIGMILTQSKCKKVHIWDSVRAPFYLSKLKKLIRHLGISVICHQMLPGESFLTDLDLTSRIHKKPVEFDYQYLREQAKTAYNKLILIFEILLRGSLLTVNLKDSAQLLVLLNKFKKIINEPDKPVIWDLVQPDERLLPIDEYNNDNLPDGWKLDTRVSLASSSPVFNFGRIKEKAKVRVLFLVDCPRDRHPWRSQSIWYRIIGPGEALKAEGHQVLYELLDEIEGWRYILQQRLCDFVVVHRAGYSSSYKELRKVTKELRIPLIYEIDDNVINPEDLRCAGHLQEKSSHEMKAIEEWASGNAQSLSECDAAIVSTPELQSVAIKYNKNSFVISNYIPEFYKLPDYAPVSTGFDSRYFTMFYAPGSLEHKLYLESICDELRQVLSKIKNARLVLGGGLTVPKSLFSVVDQIILLPRLSPQFYMRCVESADIVLAPISIDPFSRCKSWIKVLEATAMNSPWIGANLPDYRRLQETTQTGIVIDEQVTWTNAITDIYNQFSTGKKIVSANNFNPWMSGHVDDYISVLTSISGQKFNMADASKLTLSVAGEDDSSSTNFKSLYCQVFSAGTDAAFTEDRSVYMKVLGKEFTSYTFDLKHSAIANVRIDPVDGPCRVCINNIAVVDLFDNRVLFQANSIRGYSQINVLGADVSIQNLSEFCLDVIGNDPQLILPPLLTTVAHARVTLTFKVDQSLKASLKKRFNMYNCAFFVFGKLRKILNVFKRFSS